MHNTSTSINTRLIANHWTLCPRVLPWKTTWRNMLLYMRSWRNRSERFLFFTVNRRMISRTNTKKNEHGERGKPLLDHFLCCFDTGLNTRARVAYHLSLYACRTLVLLHVKSLITEAEKRKRTTSNKSIKQSSSSTILKAPSSWEGNGDKKKPIRMRMCLRLCRGCFH